MIDTVRSGYPADMMRAAESPSMGTVEDMANEALDRMKHFAREQPTAFALYALAIGFVLGWKLKPW